MWLKRVEAWKGDGMIAVVNRGLLLFRSAPAIQEVSRFAAAAELCRAQKFLLSPLAAVGRPERQFIRC